MSWASILGKFDYQRWSKVYTDWFSNFNIEKNERKTQKNFITKQGDGAFAVVDIDTLWKAKIARSRTGSEELAKVM